MVERDEAVISMSNHVDCTVVIIAIERGLRRRSEFLYYIGNGT